MAEESPNTHKIAVPSGAPDVSALVEPSIPKVYANGFSLGLTNADTQLVLKLFGRPILVLSISYTLAKTLSEKLKLLVEQWESKTGHPLQTTESIDKCFGTQKTKTEPTK